MNLKVIIAFTVLALTLTTLQASTEEILSKQYYKAKLICFKGGVKGCEDVARIVMELSILFQKNNEVDKIYTYLSDYKTILKKGCDLGSKQLCQAFNMSNDKEQQKERFMAGLKLQKEVLPMQISQHVSLIDLVIHSTDAFTQFMQFYYTKKELLKDNTLDGYKKVEFESIRKQSCDNRLLNNILDAGLIYNLIFIDKEYKSLFTFSLSKGVCKN